MNAIKILVKVTLATYAIVALSACGKTSNSGSTAASTPVSSCSLQTDGRYSDSSGALCDQGTLTCPQSGQYTDKSGNHTCTAGQTVYVNNNYPYPTNPTTQTNGCAYWTQYYNTLYIPMILNNNYVCVNYEWLNMYAYGSPYYNNYNYYYQYPPYSQGNQQSCRRSVNLSYGNFSGAVCF